MLKSKKKKKKKLAQEVYRKMLVEVDNENDY